MTPTWLLLFNSARRPGHFSLSPHWPVDFSSPFDLSGRIYTCIIYIYIYSRAHRNRRLCFLLPDLCPHQKSLLYPSPSPYRRAAIPHNVEKLRVFSTEEVGERRRVGRVAVRFRGGPRPRRGRQPCRSKGHRAVAKDFILQRFVLDIAHFSLGRAVPFFFGRKFLKCVWD